MMQHVEVTRNGDLVKREWRFWYDERRHQLVLDSYRKLARETKRHGYKIVDGTEYARILRRGSQISATAVPLPADVKDEALKKFADTLTVTIWK